ncbi:MAG TPA: efflux RND transporter periplasmic adaptor subunit [Planctomycetota bacterium]|nr:efflux RND transporter periplasmic adaptor subunit [Planctomycetota bacterium]
MKKKIFGAVVLVLVVLAGLGGVKALQIRKLMAAGSSFVLPPETVSSAVAHEEKWQGILETVGSVVAVQGVNVSAELAGAIREISFESGALANKGDVLARLDTSTEEAQLRALQAQAELAQIDATRLRKLRADKMISEADLDSAEATLKQALANADAVRAAISKKTITAPFAGQLGLRLVNLGEFVDTGKTIVSLQSLDTVFADFSLPQQDLVHLQPGMHIRLVTDTYTNQVFDGKLTAINPEVDVTTRSVRLRGTFENPEHRLRPGMFARIEVLLPVEHPELVIPSTALLSAPYGQSVFVIEPKKGTNQPAGGLVVRQQFVRTGRSRGDFVAVEAGLQAGERVVSAGALKLRNGMAVVENNALTTKPDLKPHPTDG